MNCRDLDQSIGAQRVAGLDQIDDQVGQPDQRTQFHRAVERDDLGVDAALAEKVDRQVGILGGDARLALVAQRRVGAIGRAAQAEPAVAKGQQQRLVDLATALAQRVQPADADIGRAVLDIGRHVAGLGHDVAQAAVLAGNDQACGPCRRRGSGNAGTRHQSRAPARPDVPWAGRPSACRRARGRRRLAPRTACRSCLIVAVTAVRHVAYLFGRHDPSTSAAAAPARRRQTPSPVHTSAWRRPVRCASAPQGGRRRGRRHRLRRAGPARASAGPSAGRRRCRRCPTSRWGGRVRSRPCVGRLCAAGQQQPVDAQRHTHGRLGSPKVPTR